MSALVYAGVGARYGVPVRVLERATRIASELRDAGFSLRSGGAIGMDAAFLAGATKDATWVNAEQGRMYFSDEGNLLACVYRPEHVTPAAYEMAAKFHPVWDSLGSGTRLLHARSVMIVLGWSLKSPVRRVLCWTPGGATVGGTATAIRVARAHDIEVRNMADDDDEAQTEMALGD